MKDRIRQIMEAQHMNQQTFAAATGINTATLSSIFSGRTNPTTKIVEAIHNKFPNVRTDWLMWGTGGMFEMSGDDAGVFDSDADSMGSYGSDGSNGGVAGGANGGTVSGGLFGSDGGYGAPVMGTTGASAGASSGSSSGVSGVTGSSSSADSAAGSSSSSAAQRDSFGSANVTDRNRRGGASQHRQNQQNGQRMNQGYVPQVAQIQAVAPVHQRRITEIRVYYDDQTWESFTPKK